jgi:diguanylate cyclase (GGDEF)-like protein
MPEAWNKSNFRGLILPGGLVLACAAVVAHSGWFTLPSPSLNFLFYCALLGGLLLAWRFHSSRIFLSLVIIYLSQLALGLLAPAHSRGWLDPGVGALSFLIPINFILIGFMHERGFTLPSIAPPFVVLFMQAVFVAVLAGGGEARDRARQMAASSVPNYVFAAFAAAGLVLFVRSLRSHKPADNALFWALSACFFSLFFHLTMRVSSIYSLAALSILALSIVETSYLFAYHDELTTLPSRRAFNDALQTLEAPYSIATVDIDHFKTFNDTYGHDVGDQVLRLVAARLEHVTGGGRAYRCGGEEFTILFPKRNTSEVLPHLEQLRVTVENAQFHMRGSDRRQVPRGPERRSGQRSRTRKADVIRQLARNSSENTSRESLSVTVSIGVASCLSPEIQTDEVLEAADKALYRAKANGRNRVETAASRRRSGRAKAAGIA